MWSSTRKNLIGNCFHYSSEESSILFQWIFIFNPFKATEFETKRDCQKYWLMSGFSLMTKVLRETTRVEVPWISVDFPIDGNPWEWHGGPWESILIHRKSMGIDFPSILRALIMDFGGIGKRPNVSFSRGEIAGVNLHAAQCGGLVLGYPFTWSEEDRRQVSMKKMAEFDPCLPQN